MSLLAPPLSPMLPTLARVAGASFGADTGAQQPNVTVNTSGMASPAMFFATLLGGAALGALLMHVSMKK